MALTRPLEELGMRLKHFREHDEWACENLKDEKVDEKVCQSERQMAEWGLLPESTWIRTSAPNGPRCALWERETEQAGVGSPGSP